MLYSVLKGENSMHTRKHSVLSRLLATLLAVVMMIGIVGYVPEARAVSQFETGFYKPLDGLKKTSGFIPYRTAVSNGQTYTGVHLATDYSTTNGKWNVMAIYDGTVYKVHTKLNSGAGRYVILEHKLGGVRHLQLLQLFRAL